VPLVNAEGGHDLVVRHSRGAILLRHLDTFDDEAGRDAHLNGKVAAALMEKAKAG